MSEYLFIHRDTDISRGTPILFWKNIAANMNIGMMENLSIYVLSAR